MELKYKNNESIFNEHFDDELKYLSFDMFDGFDWLKNGFTTRHGGVSTDYRSSLNFSDTVGDTSANILENFTRLARRIDTPVDNLICSDQTHTNNLLVVERSMMGEGVTRKRSFHDIDGLMTDIPGICLVTTYADCVPLYFVDPVKHVIALSHSGWRGTVNKIGRDTVEKMEEQFGCKRSDILCAIGPSICQDCYEVSSDVINEFKKAFDDKYHDEIYYARDNGKYQLNLWNACRITLKDAGIPESNISVTNLCTACNHNDLFSHRKSHGKRGNMAAFLKICF